MRLGVRRQGQRAVPPVSGGRLHARLMAAHATRGFAGHQRGEALHAFHGDILRIERYEEHAPQRRGVKARRAIRLHRHRAEDAFQRECPAVTQRLHAAGEVDRLGQRFQHEELLNLARLHAGHVSPVIDVDENEAAGDFRQVDARRNDLFPRARRDRPRLVCEQAGLDIAGRKREQLQFVSAPIHHDDGTTAGPQRNSFRTMPKDRDNPVRP